MSKSSPWRTLIDGWIRNGEVRRDALVALALVLAAVVTVVAIVASTVVAIAATVAGVLGAWLTGRRREKLARLDRRTGKR